MTSRPKTIAYTAKDKLAILKEIDACKQPATRNRIMGIHSLSTEEIAEWRRNLELYGLNGLRALRKSMVN